MLAIHGCQQRVCSGLTRRDVIRAGDAGLLGTSLAQVLAAEDAGAVVCPRAVTVILADLDKDGRLDIAACAERGANELRWWRNVTPKK